MNSDKAFWIVVFIALLLCNIGFAVLCANWRNAYTSLHEANSSLLQAATEQAREGDELIRMVGEMAEHGFCIAPDKPPSRHANEGGFLDV